MESSTKDSQDSGADLGKASKVPALSKAVAVIRYLNHAPETGRSLAELTEKLQIGKSHCFNILKTLVEERWLSYDLGRRTYSLAPTLLTDVSRLAGGSQRSTLVHNELTKLSQRVGTPCLLARVEREGTFLVIDKAERATELLMSAPIGHRFAADTAAQMRVRLAWMEPDAIKRELQRWKPVRYTETTLTRKSDVLAEIKATRERGYAISRAEILPGIMTVAAPIFDAFGDVEMVLQCPGVSEVIRPRIKEIAEPLLATCSRITAIVGGRGHDIPNAAE